MLKNKKIYMIPVFGFMVLILILTLLLMLPISTNGSFDNLNLIFLATSAVTGTGLTTSVVSQNLSLFGQIILMLAIQIGALGFMIFFSLILFARNKKIRLIDTLILSNEINFSNNIRVKEKVKNIIKYTFIIEFFGAMLLAINFIPEYGVSKGIWYGIFHSVSAFCNSGIDLIGDASLEKYATNIPINIITMIIMFCGGIGYFVLQDIHDCIISGRKKLQIYTKITLVTSLLIIVSATIFLKILMPSLTILQAMFYSITSRSTGFFTVNPTTLNSSSKLLVVFLMFIGGGAGSTAGGIRLLNFAILCLLPLATIRDEEIVIGYRKIDINTIKKSITIVISYVFLVIVAFMILLSTESINSMDLLFEIVSAFTNTGLSTFDINDLAILGKIILIIYMYIGRLGPITFLALFTSKSKQINSVSYPNADLML